MWRHLPWLTGLLVAPLIYGSVTAEGQAVTGLLFAASLLLLVKELGARSRRTLHPVWLWLAGLWLVLPLIPLPANLAGWFSPERLALARSFPVQPGEVSSWVTLSLSPARTIQRGWELALVISCFILSRHGARRADFPRVFCRFLAAAVLLLAASDIYLRWEGGELILGHWRVQSNYAAGTFANRNHFANWVFVASLFLLGWLLREIQPLHSARLDHLARNSDRRWPMVLLGAVLGLGLVIATATGSRGGCLAFAAGLVIWVVLLAKRSRSRKRWLVMGGAGMLLALAMLGSAHFLLERLATVEDGFSFKAGIWKRSAQIAAQYPIFGVGPGAFVRAFNYYKVADGEKTFWHAENDLVQWLMESGLPGFLLAAGLLFSLLAAAARHAWRAKMREPELFLGALAALGAFVVHAQFEFVFQIPANALLAAALLGFVTGMRDTDSLPAAPSPPSRARLVFNWAWALLVLIMAALQVGALLSWPGARRSKNPEHTATAVRQSLRFWPWDGDRWISWLHWRLKSLRQEPRARQLEMAPAIRAEFLAGLARDPLNWQMRLELAWFDLAFPTRLSDGLAQARMVAKLNPLQPQIPLRFARHFSARDPVTTMEFLQRLNLEDPALLRQAYGIAWFSDPQPAILWSLTPDTPAGLQTLADFALGKGLTGLALQACQQLSNRVDNVFLARRFLQMGRADLAAAALPQDPVTNEARLLLLEIHLLNRRFVEALRMAEKVWRASRLGRSLELPFPESVARKDDHSRREPDLSELRAEFLSKPQDVAIARRLAEAVFAQPLPQRDLALLQNLRARFPQEPRLLWMLVQSEWEAGRFEAAARLAKDLADEMVRLK